MDSFTLLSGRIIIRVSIDKRVDGKDSARVDVEVRHEASTVRKGLSLYIEVGSNYKYHP